MLNNRKFQRRTENFKCVKCETEVFGNGFTDHCPKCLFSLHIDINPGDRKADCKGFMEPYGIIIKGKNISIFYKCLKCGKKFKVKPAENDNFDEILKLAKKVIIF